MMPVTVLHTARYVIAHSLPDGRGSATEPRASASDLPQILMTLCILSFAMTMIALGQDRPIPPSGSVSLPLEEYNKLVEQGAKAGSKPGTPPLPYAVRSANLNFEIKGDSVSGVVQLDGEVLAHGIINVSLAQGLTIFDARRKGKDLPIGLHGGVHSTMLQGPGDFSLELDVGLPLTFDVGRARFQLPPFAAGSVRLTLALPGENTTATVSPGLIVAHRTTNGRTIIEAVLEPQRPTVISWAARENSVSTAPREVRFLSEIKTLVTAGETELEVAALASITVLQGEPAQFEVAIPPGFEVSGVTGVNLESSEIKPGSLWVKLTPAAAQTYQFLISLEKPLTEPKTTAPIVSFKGAQRETGEVLVESQGALELTAAESGGLKRMDLKEVNPFLRALARYQLQAAFRYHLQPQEQPGLALSWVRFPDSPTLAAVAQQAVVTTMVTSEGKSLTEVELTLRNQSQPFLKVTLPAGASILTADVAGEKVKPVLGPDGSRVPLLRSGFRPAGSYKVSFVFMHSGNAFAKKGGSELSLPKMDIPIGLVNWEVFLPAKYKVADFGGDALHARVFPAFTLESEEAVVPRGFMPPSRGTITFNASMLPGQLGGIIVDASGAAIQGVQVTVTHLQTSVTAKAVTDPSGRWVTDHIQTGRVRISANAPGFWNYSREIDYDAQRPSALNFSLEVGSVTATAQTVQTSMSQTRSTQRTRDLKKSSPPLPDASQNVLNLQRRVAGVLPVAIEIPRSGASYRFIRPLVIDEETKVTFTYKTK